MDVEKAFDKVWHAGLIHTLINIQLPMIYLRYITSFISQRHMFFRIENLESTKIKLNFGEPQGSSLSPILFLVHVSNIPKPQTHNTFISQFADDIKVYSTSRSLNTIQTNLQKSINQIISFCGEQRIGINETKSFELIFRKNSHKTTAEDEAKHITFRNTPIPMKSHGKFLGLTIDQKLSFTNHITTIKSIAKSRTLRLQSLHHSKYGPSNSTMVRLFKIFIRPLLEYGHIATITANKKHMNHWESIQTSFIRHTFKLPYIHNNHTRKLANLPTITDRLLQLSDKWYNKAITVNKEIINFIEQHVRKDSRLKTPYNIITKKIPPNPQYR